METEKLSAVTAAVLADAAFDATGGATRFSTQRYREIIEYVRRTGELPPVMSSHVCSPRGRTSRTSTSAVYRR